MNRLTKKNNQGTGSWTQFGDEYIPAHNIKHKQCVNKLGKLEDLEDHLGCPLEIREKTLDSFYCPELENNKKLHSYYVYGFDDCDLFVYLSYSKYDDYYDEETKIPLKDYKKTWWLSKEECDG